MHAGNHLMDESLFYDFERVPGIPIGHYDGRTIVNGMKLQQGQVWKQGMDYLRIVHWERKAIVYKLMKDLSIAEGTEHNVTKKEFCRMLKGAMLLDPMELKEIARRTMLAVAPAETQQDGEAPA